MYEIANRQVFLYVAAICPVNEARRDLPHGLFRVRFAFWGVLSIYAIWSVLYRCKTSNATNPQGWTRKASDSYNHNHTFCRGAFGGPSL